MSEETGIQGLTTFSGEPPRDSRLPGSLKWYAISTTLFTISQNDPLKVLKMKTWCCALCLMIQVTLIVKMICICHKEHVKEVK